MSPCFFHYFTDRTLLIAHNSGSLTLEYSINFHIISDPHYPTCTVFLVPAVRLRLWSHWRDTNAPNLKQCNQKVEKYRKNHRFLKTFINDLFILNYNHRSRAAKRGNAFHVRSHFFSNIYGLVFCMVSRCLEILVRISFLRSIQS